MTGEQRLWNYLRPKLKKYGHFERIESHDTVVGTPDVNYCINGYTNHLELKYSSSARKGFRLRPSQAGWFKKRVKAGGQPWLLAHAEFGKSNGYVLIPGADVPELAHTTYIGDWLQKGVAAWQDKIEIAQLAKLLATMAVMTPNGVKFVSALPEDSKDDKILVPPEKKLILPVGTRSATKPSS